MEKPKRILISRIDKIGDVVLSTPVIENVRKAYPDAYIAFMCRPITKDIVNGNPYLDEVIVYDKDGRHKNFLKTFPGVGVCYPLKANFMPATIESAVSLFQPISLAVILALVIALISVLYFVMFRRKYSTAFFLHPSLQENCSIS